MFIKRLIPEIEVIEGLIKLCYIDNGIKPPDEIEWKHLEGGISFPCFHLASEIQKKLKKETEGE